MLTLGILRILKKMDRIITVRLPGTWLRANLHPCPGPQVSPLCLEPRLGPCGSSSLCLQPQAPRRRKGTPVAAAARKLLRSGPSEKWLSVLQHADGQLRVTRAGRHGLLQHQQQPRLLILQLERAVGTGASPGPRVTLIHVTNVSDTG